MVYNSNFEHYSQNLGDKLSLILLSILIEYNKKDLFTVFILMEYSILLENLKLREI